MRMLNLLYNEVHLVCTRRQKVLHSVDSISHTKYQFFKTQQLMWLTLNQSMDEQLKKTRL